MYRMIGYDFCAKFVQEKQICKLGNIESGKVLDNKASPVCFEITWA